MADPSLRVWVPEEPQAPPLSPDWRQAVSTLPADLPGVSGCICHGTGFVFLSAETKPSHPQLLFSGLNLPTFSEGISNMRLPTILSPSCDLVNFKRDFPEPPGLEGSSGASLVTETQAGPEGPTPASPRALPSDLSLVTPLLCRVNGAQN